MLLVLGSRAPTSATEICAHWLGVQCPPALSASVSAQNLFLATHAFSSIDTADAAGRAYRHRGGAGTGPEFAVHGGASTTHRDMSRSMGGARAPLYAAWCPGPDLSGSSVRCLLGVEIMWRSRRDDACTTPSCEVTDAIAFADFGAPGAGPRLGIPRVSGKSVVPRRDDRTAPLPTSYYVHAICHDRPEPRSTTRER